jgi:hypothetical protein
MRMLQHYYRKTYAVTIAALETGVGLACLQEPYLDRKFRNGGYQIYWPENRTHRNRRLAIAIRRELLHK